MPMQTGWYGKEKDGTANSDYCVYCYKDGAFTEPDLTLEGMVEKSIMYMTGHMKFPLAQAEKLSNDVIPKLKRWN